MRASSKDLVPVLMAATVAMFGLAALLVTDFDSTNDVGSHGISMITAAAVGRAGATLLPTADGTTGRTEIRP